MLGRFCKPVSSFGLGLPPFQSFRVKPKCMDHSRVRCYSPFCPWEGLREGPPCLALFWGRGRSYTLAGCFLYHKKGGGSEIDSAAAEPVTSHWL